MNGFIHALMPLLVSVGICVVLPIWIVSLIVKAMTRKMDLLPTPAMFGSEEDARLQENIRLVRLIRQALKRHCRRQMVEAIVLNVLLCAVLALVAFFLLGPSVQSDSRALQFILEWRYLLVGLLCTGSLMFSLSRTDLFRI